MLCVHIHRSYPLRIYIEPEDGCRLILRSICMVLRYSSNSLYFIKNQMYVTMSTTDRALVRILIQINSDVSLQFKVSIFFLIFLSRCSLTFSIKLSVSGLITKSLQVCLFHAICSTFSTHHILLCPITENIEFEI
jgi:hypothetical protein